MIKNVTLTRLTQIINDKRNKKNGKKFTISDVQSYTRRGHLPLYLGGEKISTNKSSGVKLYSVDI